MDNLKTLMDTVVRLKPSSAKGTYIKAMAVGTTMGPGIKIDTASVRNFLD